MEIENEIRQYINNMIIEFLKMQVVINKKFKEDIIKEIREKITEINT